eukprot:g1658.t1
MMLWLLGISFTCAYRLDSLMMDCSNPNARMIVGPILIFLVPLVIGVFSPHIWFIWVLSMCVVRPAFNASARRARSATSRRRAAIDCLSNFPCESKQRWRSRGWLVLLRARHQRYLARQEQRSRSWRCRRKLKHLYGITWAATNDPLDVAGVECLVGAKRTEDIAEACEEGYSHQEFARAVISVVGIVEEGLFRDIVSFL